MLSWWLPPRNEPRPPAWDSLSRIGEPQPPQGRNTGIENAQGQWCRYHNTGGTGRPGQARAAIDLGRRTPASHCAPANLVRLIFKLLVLSTALVKTTSSDFFLPVCQLLLIRSGLRCGIQLRLEGGDQPRQVGFSVSLRNRIGGQAWNDWDAGPGPCSAPASAGEGRGDRTVPNGCAGKTRKAPPRATRVAAGPHSERRSGPVRVTVSLHVPAS